MGGRKILIVEDEESLSKMIAVRLKAAGYAVIAAYDGNEAFELAMKESPDLIILDLLLPKVDGYKVCGLLKKNVLLAKIPIIIVTARAQETDIKLGKDMGADAYIIKPFDAEVLLSKIKELLK